MVSKTLCSHFACQGSYSATHTKGAWTKLHNKVMSWISGTYECQYAWPLPEADAATVRDLTVPSVSSLPLSVMVRSRAFIGVELVHQTWICFSTCANLKSVRSFKISVYGHKQTYIHTYTRFKQCSHASVGLTQARPNDIVYLRSHIQSIHTTNHCIAFPY